ncbi:MAG: alpha/beta fold hydrolase [Planctomycetota bacterium]|nr:alpha/beta fold hydrolase [Planctomycetota bacterium]
MDYLSFRKTFRLSCLVALLSQFPLAAADPVTLPGTWYGELNLVVQKLRIGFKIENAPDGSFKGVMDSIDQSAFGIPLSAVQREKAQVQIEVESLGVVFKATLSEDGQELAGTFRQNGIPLPLKLRRVGRYPTIQRPQEPQPPFPYDELEVTYRNELHDVKLAGTLSLPRSERPLAAVLLITGSGSQDRDESIAGHRPFMVIADALARRGVAVLRMDDRGVGGSTRGESPATTLDLAEDVLTGVRFLSGHAKIDDRRIGLAGHSEGGLIAPLVAARTDEIAFIVMLAGPGLPGSQILEQQARLIGEAAKRPEWFLDWNHKVQLEMFRIIGDHEDPVEGRKQLGAQLDDWMAMVPDEHAFTRDTLRAQLEGQFDSITSPWFRYFLSHDPAPVLQQVPCPVLALFGSKDLQVPAEENKLAVLQALEKGHNQFSTARVFDDLNHLFQACQTGSPVEYGSIEETFNEQALNYMVDWIVRHTETEPVRLSQRRRLRRWQGRALGRESTVE